MTIKNLFTTILFITFSINISANELLESISSTPSNAFIQSTNTQLKFSQLSLPNGLSSSNVFGITQDHQGFIWFATEDGLNRFDGNSFVTYRHNTNNKNSIADNVIRKIFIDSRNTLWIGTQNGLSRYNVDLDNFDNYVNKANDDTSLKDNVIWDIYQNKSSITESTQDISLLWISTTEGLHSISVNTPRKNIKFQRLSVRNYNDKLREIKTIFQDRTGTLWLGSYDKGIHLLSKNLTYIGSLNKQNKHNLSIDATALFDMKIIDNNYWLATNNGLYIVDDRYQLVSHLTTVANDNSNGQTLLSSDVRAIAQYDENNVWLATHNGLNTINLLNSQVESYQHNTNPSSISENWLMDIYRDSNNNMWLASYGEGVNKYSSLSSLFSHKLASNENQKYRVQSFTETLNGTIWVSTEKNGLITIKNGKIKQQNIVNFTDNIIQLITDEHENIFFLTQENKLFMLQADSEQLVEQKNWFLTTSPISKSPLIMINEEVWFLDQTGSLSKYHIKTQEVSRFATPANMQFLKIIKDNLGKIRLLSSTGKLLSFNLKRYQFEKNIIQFDSSIDIHSINNIQITNENIFLGSDSQGLTIQNINSNKIITFNENDQLKNNYIASMVVDLQNKVWISTNTGIICITSINEGVLTFDSDFGINSPEFIKKSALASSDGKVYFGSPNGFYVFSSNDVKQTKNTIQAPVFLNLYVANKKITISHKSKDNIPTLSKQLNYMKEVELAYKDSPISFDFISPNTKLTAQLHYRYQLIGLEKQWIDAVSVTDGSPRATYTNLSPGDYIFKVEAFDIHDPTNAQTSQLNVTILPPWWLSTSMLIAYSLITILFFNFIYQQYKNKKLYHSQIKESEERLKLSLWGSGDEMWDWNIITDKIYRSNIWGILDFPQDGTRNKNELGSNRTNIHQHDIEKVKTALADHFTEKTEHFEATYRVKNKYSQWVWILDRGKIVERDENNKPARMTGTLKDISQIKKAEESLKLFARCIQNISDAVVIYDRQFFIVDVNKAFQRITGKQKSQMIGQSLLFEQYPKNFTQNIKEHLLTKGSWYGEIESIRPDGSQYLTDLNIDIIHDENNKISHFVGVFSDITKRKETEAELRKLASSDILTGLPNRSYFQANQARLVKRNINHALLVFDLDNFKKINDSMGHQIGDDILCQVAKRMLKLSRTQDTVYRLGGDEFSIIIEGTNNIHTITALAKEILHTVALPFKIKNQEIVLYSSIGIVLFPEDGITGHELLKKADTAMYHAKGNGGNKYQFFSESMNKQAVKRLQIESLIRHGLKEDSFSVYYQPKIEISTGKIAGMEALVRFETPNKGIISPVVFIPVSEETGQIIDIGEIVLRKSCFATKKWVDEGLFDGRVAVNLSAVQFTQANLVTQIANILAESQLPPKHLELEITEGTVMNSPQEAIETMLQIRAMGIHLSLDDFGTGYSSLAYLKKFPLNTLKIDKAFVDDIEESEQGRNMVATIVTIAHNLGMDVVAEGVETNQQLSFLSGLNCEQLQGYLYSKPLATEHFKQYLIAHKVTNRSTNFSI